MGFGLVGRPLACGLLWRMRFACRIPESKFQQSKDASGWTAPARPIAASTAPGRGSSRGIRKEQRARLLRALCAQRCRVSFSWSSTEPHLTKQFWNPLIRVFAAQKHRNMPECKIRMLHQTKIWMHGQLRRTCSGRIARNALRPVQCS